MNEQTIEVHTVEITVTVDGKRVAYEKQNIKAYYPLGPFVEWFDPKAEAAKTLRSLAWRLESSGTADQ